MATRRVPASRPDAPRHLRRVPPPPPQSPAPARASATPPIAQFVVLSMLLHVLAIALFGAPSGGSREGRAMWGALKVDLPGMREAAPRLKLDRELVAPVTPVVPTIPTPARANPGIAKPRRVQAYGTEPLPAPPPPVPLLLDRVVRPEHKLEMPPPPQVPPPVEPQAVVPPAESAPLPSIAPIAAPAPVEMPAALPVESAPIEAPSIPVVTPTPPVERPPIELKAIPVPALENIVPPRIEAPVPEAPPQLPPIIRPEPVEAPAAVRPAPVEVAPKVERDSPIRFPDRPDDGRQGRPASPSGEDRGEGPSLDLDALRKRAGQIAREGSGRRAILPFPMPPVPEKKSKLETAIEKARKPDCRTAYQEMGLLAVVPLVANEFGEGNCRW